jgi:hypothetical protein
MATAIIRVISTPGIGNDLLGHNQVSAHRFSILKP